MTPWYALLHLLLFGQSIPFPGPGMPAAAGSVSISNHGVTVSPSSCTNGSSTCAQSGSDTKATVGATGDTLVAVVHIATNAGATSPTGCTVTASYGATSMTFITAAFSSGASGATVPIWPFYLKNATAGSDFLSFSISGAGCSFFFVQGVFWADLGGASISAPLDASVSNATSGGSQPLTITSAGNVTNSGEVALCFVSRDTAISGYSGVFTLLDSGATANGDASVTNPTSGATTTCTATGSAGQNSMSIFAFTH